MLIIYSLFVATSMILAVLPGKLRSTNDFFKARTVLLFIWHYIIIVCFGVILIGLLGPFNPLAPGAPEAMPAGAL